ncbi:flagellar biosynthesis regulatory protein FlaF [Roseivivax isoporae LMG 25204]|uniref:Flagellar biosynthesis regulatory protein FlaF n=1 Tax=Roseivivax isoporae LMG 25204 TaxID=1449351 RepID=X7FAF0_9RHOB|nr:flagellar biosynthesis regulatory protein FlaF [Roseivivax isoporae LMG 25204]
MHAHAQALHAYSHAAAPIRTARGAEYEVIARITHRLRDAARKGKRGYPELVAALSDNRRLWTTLAADVGQAGNGLPDDLRARIFYLAEFTEKHSRLVLRGKARVTPLLEINVAILRGLGSRPHP